MDDFERNYLLIDKSIGLVPGPREINDPFYSTDIDEWEWYVASDIQKLFSDLTDGNLHPDCSKVPYYGPTRWMWTEIDSSIQIIDGGEMETDEGSCWGGADLMVWCTFEHLLNFSEQIRAKYPAIWLHDDDCRMLTRTSFLERYALPGLEKALSSEIVSNRERAEQLATQYSLTIEQLGKN